MQITMQSLPVSFSGLFSFFIFSSHHLTTSIHGGKIPPPYLLEDIAINCGCLSNSTALDGRNWVGEAPLLRPNGQSKTSTSARKFLSSVESTPYMTARISSTHFHYNFRVNPGQKFIRLHFYPVPFEYSRDLFTVKANSFTLLKNFNPSLDADALGVKYIVKEFCLNVNETGNLQIAFFASQRSSKWGDNYVFVNGIEIISMPTDLYYAPDNSLGAHVVGQSNVFHKIDNSIALESVLRLNVGGGSISSVDDTCMFRRWSEDADYLLEYEFQQVNDLVSAIETMNAPLFVAPLQIYQTSRKMSKNLHLDGQYYLTLNTHVDLGFGYLLRLHFCDLGVGSPEGLGFDVLIQNIVAETRANVVRWSGGNGIPVYRDYYLMMKGDETESKCDLFISLQSTDELVGGYFKGLEIFKLSNANNSLASQSSSSSGGNSTFWTMKTEIFVVAFGKFNVIMTVLTILLATVNTGVYKLRQTFEHKLWHEKSEQSALTEPSCRYFPLAEILLATQNFSEELVIGKGGFGKVYKGYIFGHSEILAIKRLKAESKQGEHEFWREIETLSKLRHIHLVSLIGYCNESKEMILVYEYMPRGTVADNLYKAQRIGKDATPLTWEERLRICVGAARGLDYLHTGTKYGVIHRDVKDTNILLDENFVAKISDFGLSELGKVDETQNQFCTKVRGTIGYLDPHYLKTATPSIKSDVYAFGIVLLVVLTGKPALERGVFGEIRSLLSCYRECIKKGDTDEMIDSCLHGEISTESLTIFMETIKNCVQNKPKKRPTMAQVAVHLEYALEKQSSPPSISGDETDISQHHPGGSSPPFEFYELKVMESKTPSPATSRYLATTTTSSGNNQDLSGFRSILQSHIYNFSEISSATKNFKLKPLSSSSSSTSWRCVMHGQEVILIQRKFQYFMKIPKLTEKFGLICRSHHSSLVKLKGASISRDYIYLVYDYIHGGNLADCLRNPDSPHFNLLSNWMSRVKIAANIAHGLDYIHHSNGLSFKFVHNHIKSTSIIVTPNLDAKICHFGTAELCEDIILYQSYDSQRKAEVKRSGYVSPEYIETIRATQKTDVYAFGVVILELLSGEDPSGEGAKESVIQMGRQAVEGPGGGVRRWVDKRLKDSFPVEVAEKLVGLGLECVSEDPYKRPGMGLVAARISKLFLESETWLVEKMGRFPPDLSVSLSPR